MFISNKRGGLSRSGTPRPAGGQAIAPPSPKGRSGPSAPILSNVGNAPAPTRSRRDYGKTAPAPGSMPQPSPFGPTQGGM